MIFHKLSCIGRLHMQFVTSTILSPNHKEVAFMFPYKYACVHTLSPWLMVSAVTNLLLPRCLGAGNIYKGLEENTDAITFVITIFQVVLLFRITTREMVIVFDNFVLYMDILQEQ